jgi:hypothetical protein
MPLVLVSRNFVSLVTSFFLAAIVEKAGAQEVVVSSYYPPAVSYYYAPPTVSYSVPTTVSYYVPTTVSYYSPQVAYYSAPTAYYAPSTAYYSAVPVTTTRYGLFGRPRTSTTYYYSPTYISP